MLRRYRDMGLPEEEFPFYNGACFKKSRQVFKDVSHRR